MNNLIRRSRSLSVLGIVLGGALGLIASTQTWIFVTVTDGAPEPLEIAGATALAVLAPLSLAALALGVALSIIGRALRHAFAIIAVAIGAVLIWLTATVLTGPPVAYVASVVTETTGISGESSVGSLVNSMTLTAWPAVALASWVIIVLAGVLALATAHTWKSSGKKYEQSAAHHAKSSGPLDAVDSWDDLSRGDDPTN